MHIENFEQLGSWLRNHREKRNLSIEEIAQITKIRPAMIEMIEAGAGDRIPLPYLLPSLRTIGRLLNIPSEELEETLQALSAFHPATASAGAASDTPQASAVSRQRRWIFLIAVVAVLVIVLLWWNPFHSPLSGPSSPTSPPPPPSMSSSPPEVSVAPEAQTSDYKDTLIITATAIDSVWISVVTDDARKWQELLPPGAQRQWGSKQWLQLSVGNAGGLHLIVNADTIGTLGRRGAVLKDIKITASGVERLPHYRSP